MKVVAWNSQGAKWERMWEFMTAARDKPGTDVIGVIAEAGWAPWIDKYGDNGVADNGVYSYTKSKGLLPFAGATSYDRAHPLWQNCHDRRVAVCWIPWVKTLAASLDDDETNQNARCSMGIIWSPGGQAGVSMDWPTVMGLDWSRDIITRPVPRITLSRGPITVFWLSVVHLVSKYPAAAVDQINTIAGMVAQSYTGVDGMMLGDFNVDLLQPKQNQRLAEKMPRNYQLRNIGVPTQKKDGELDYSLVSRFNNAAPTIKPTIYWKALAKHTNSSIATAQAGLSGSDHAAIVYDIS